ncbi:MAG: sulfotransferase domain-containing protein [Hyphomicrobiales bacterium]|nr:sulfotransferase domain-containing protein [Hyphomicrobiales bacterium]
MGALMWLASYPKSGNTWMRSFLHNLLRGSDEPVAINDLDHFCLGESDSKWYTRHFEGVLKEAGEEEVARIRPKGQRDMTRAFPDTVFVKTHNFLGEKHETALHNMDVTAGAIYIVRNPLDVALSMTHHFGTDIDAAIDRLGQEGAITDMSDTHIMEYHASWSTHVSSWTARENRGLLVMRYEDMLAKPRREFRRVSDFLGLKPSRDRLDRAIRNSSFKTLQSQERRKDFKERSEYSKAFFRVGKEGQWKGILDSDQVARVVERHGEQMARFGYLPGKKKK